MRQVVCASMIEQARGVPAAEIASRAGVAIEQASALQAEFLCWCDAHEDMFSAWEDAWEAFWYQQQRKASLARMEAEIKHRSLEQRAATNAKRLNKKVAGELPLLAAMDAIPADWLTTPEQQAVRLTEIAAGADAFFDHLRELEVKNMARACMFRDICMELTTPDGFAALVAQARYTQHCGPEYKLDFWHRAAARLDARFCPHAERDHNIFLAGERCPICGLVKGPEKGKGK